MAPTHGHLTRQRSRRDVRTGLGPLPAPGAANPWAMVALFLWALFLRLVYLRQISTNPFFDHPIGEPLLLDATARIVAGGNWIGAEKLHGGSLYPYLLGVVHGLFGADWLAPRVVQALLGSLTVVVVYLLGRRLFGETAGLLAGGIAGACSPMIYFDAEILPNVLENLLFLSAAALFLNAANSGRARLWFAGGLAAGLGIVARPGLFALLPGAFLWIALQRGGARRPRRPAAFSAAGAALVLLPWLLLRAGAGGGGEAALPGTATPDVQLAAADQGPLDAATGPRERFRLFWSAREVGEHQDPRFLRHYSALLRFPLPGFLVVASLGLAGMAFLTRTGGTALLAGMIFIVCGSCLFDGCGDRHRLLVLPVLSVFAGGLVVWVVERYRVGRAALAGLGVLAAGIAALGLVRAAAGIPPASLAPMWAAVGEVHLEKGEVEEAEKALRTAMEIDPARPGTHALLARALTGQGRLDEAVREYREGIAVGGENPELLTALASILQGLGRYDEAVELYLSACEGGDDRLQTTYDLGLCFMRLGRLDEAEAAFRRVIAREPRHVNALTNLGVVAAERSRYDEAASFWKRALAIDPGFLRARDNLEAMERERARKAGKGAAPRAR